MTLWISLYRNNSITWQELKPSMIWVYEGNKLQCIWLTEPTMPFLKRNTACSGSCVSSFSSWNHFFTREFNIQVSAIQKVHSSGELRIVHKINLVTLMAQNILGVVDNIKKSQKIIHTHTHSELLKISVNMIKVKIPNKQNSY